MEDLERRVAALEEALLDERARNNAHLLMIAAILKGIRMGIGNIGAYNTAKRILVENNHEMTKTNEHGAMLRELRLLLEGLPTPTASEISAQSIKLHPSPPDEPGNS